MGAFYVIRRTVFAAVGGFDEDYFVYYDDLDLSYRVQHKKYRSIFYSDLQIYHKSGGTSASIPGLRNFYSWRSRLVYARKNMSLFSYYVVLALTLVVEPSTRCILYLAQRKPERFADIFEGLRLLWKWLLFHRNDPRAVIQ